MHPIRATVASIAGHDDRGRFPMQNSTLLKILISAAVVVGGIAFFVKTTLGNTTDYMMVDELLAKDMAGMENKELKVHGWVVAGSIKEHVANQETVRTFVLQKAGKK